MKFRNISLKWQFILIITLVAMPFILLSFYNHLEEKEKAINQARQLAISTARNIGIQQKYTEAYTRQMLLLISKLSEIQEANPDRENLNNLFKTLLSENPQFSVVMAALPNGDAYAAAIPFKAFSIADRKYFKDVLRTHSFAVGEFVKSRLTGRSVLHYAMPVLGQKGKIKLILVASFDLIQFQNILSVSTLPQGSDFTFYDYSGKMLYTSRNQHKFPGKKVPPEIQGAIKSDSDQGVYYAGETDKENRLFGYIRMNIEKESPYMFIAVSTPLSETFKMADMEFYRNIVLILLAVVSSIIISLYYRNFIFRKIDRLVTIANRLKEGEMTARTNMDYSSGETGTLAQAFDKMAESIQLRENERDNALKNLKILTERFEIAVSSARIGIWEWDLITQKVFWNTQMYELYKVDESNFKHTIPDWLKNLHPDDSARFEEELHHAIRYKKNHKTSFRIKTNQQGYRNIGCYFNVITDINGKPIHVTGVNRDITERVLLEKELTRSKEGSEKKINDLKKSMKHASSSANEKLLKVLNGLEAISAYTQENAKGNLKQIMELLNDIIKELGESRKSLD